MTRTGSYRVWCLTWEDDEEVGRSYPASPPPPDPLEPLKLDGWALDARNAAEMYAEWCHDRREGWDCTWPLQFRVRSPDGSLEDFEVEREYEPTFSAHEMKTAVAADLKPAAEPSA